MYIYQKSNHFHVSDSLSKTHRTRQKKKDFANAAW